MYLSPISSFCQMMPTIPTRGSIRSDDFLVQADPKWLAPPPLECSLSSDRGLFHIQTNRPDSTPPKMHHLLLGEDPRYWDETYREQWMNEGHSNAKLIPGEACLHRKSNSVLPTFNFHSMDRQTHPIIFTLQHNPLGSAYELTANDGIRYNLIPATLAIMLEGAEHLFYGRFQIRDGAEQRRRFTEVIPLEHQDRSWSNSVTDAEWYYAVVSEITNDTAGRWVHKFVFPNSPPYPVAT
ncbi:MAG: hypothetical protein ACD_62C00442G0002 [uncultured bacterium]|nr:MAG: hypothetical protein ACD_62C00442G0002 [uncultured bacterium]